MCTDQPTEVILPDLFSMCPFPWGLPNPHFSSISKQSVEWMVAHASGLFVDHSAKRARIGACNAELLGAYVYPYADAEGLRIVNDFIMILFTLDEITDDQDAKGARATREMFVRALTGTSGGDNSAVTLFTKDFLNRISGASDEVHERFVSHCISYIDAATDEACLRAEGEILSVEEYTRLRRENGGVRACFDLIEFVLGITLPAAVFEDSNFVLLYLAAIDMICWSNDIYSYAVEYARGLEGCNFITVLMHSGGISLPEAVDDAAEMFKDFADTITSCKENMHSFGSETDEAIRSCIYGMEQWVYGNLVFSFDSQRYFGAEVRHTGVVKLKQHKSVM